MTVKSGTAGSVFKREIADRKHASRRVAARQGESRSDYDQLAYLKAWRRLGTFENGDHLARSLPMFRRNARIESARRKRFSFEQPNDPSARTLDAVASDSVASGDDWIDCEVNLDELIEFVNSRPQLSENRHMREALEIVILLRHGKRVGEIAAELGKSNSVVYERLNRLRGVASKMFTEGG
jgi:DNA-directed RNA polymerase specialized sigma24 family protein